MKREIDYFRLGRKSTIPEKIVEIKENKELIIGITGTQ